MSISLGDTWDELKSRPWPEVTGAAALSTAGAIGLLAVMIARSRSGWIHVLDDANLIFHEAGHPIYGIFGSTLALYGGTLGQLTFPVVAGANFWLKRQPVSLALMGAWFFENFFNIARYMADARAQLLPLVGGGEHDWFNIFSRWGVLAHDQQIAGFVRLLGWLGLLGSAAWIILRWKRSAQTG